MIIGGSKENGVVIPRWLSYKDAAVSGELAIPASKEITFARDFTADLNLFTQSPTVFLAADLLGLAFLDNRPEAPELARYLQKNGVLSKPAGRLVRRVLGQSSEAPIQDTSVRLAIARLRSDLHRFPRNSSKWVDLARCYTACGQNGPALKALRTAVALAPQDRFCVRALCRFFIHTRDYTAAHEFFKAHSELLKDPWLLAPAASIASLADKPSPLPRLLSVDITSESEAFHKSELFEAFGTAELANGKDRSARKALRAAWQKPTHNVITHAQWVTRHLLPGLRGEVCLNFSQSAQAAAQECVERGDLKSARPFLELWKQEEPYSAGPYVLDAYLHCITEEFGKVIAVFDEARTKGLLSGMLMNNTAVAYACSGQIDEAAQLVRELKRNPGAIPEFTLLATEGLIQFAQGNAATGSLLYKEAEEKAGTTWFSNRVFLNKMLELHRFRLPIETRDKRRFEDLAKISDGFHVTQLLNNIRKFETARPADAKVNG